MKKLVPKTNNFFTIFSENNSATQRTYTPFDNSRSPAVDPYGDYQSKNVKLTNSFEVVSKNN